MEDIKNELNEEIKEEVQEETTEEVVEETQENQGEEEAQAEENNGEEQQESQESEDELTMLRRFKKDSKKTENENAALKERLVRISAEYENYRKRTAKEKESIYSDAYVDVLKEIVPVMDNIERALSSNGDLDALRTGIEMTLKSFQTTLEKLGVEEIDASGDFDPNLHQAVMHVQDENLGANQVAEVFLKGYKKGDKVVRHTVVKVAN
ncbi:MAG: nucleotide exchange factor GrpE [Clostridium sp.]